MSLRVFCPPGDHLHPGARVELEREEAHYLLRVRRARPGDAIEVLDGVGGRWHARVGDGPEVVLGEAITLPSALPEVVLLLAPPDPKAALEALAAACAGGAASIVLVQTERSQTARPGPERVARVMRATMRQCGRPSPPPLDGPLPLEHALALRPQLPGLVADAHADAHAHTWALPQSAATSGLGVGDATPGARLLIGPEGGLTDDELRAVDSAGFHRIALGPWTLRTQAAVTAGLCRLLTAPNPAW